MSGVPNGWHDTVVTDTDGKQTPTLVAPNGNVVVMGFRDFVLNNDWDPDDQPLEHEYNVNPVLNYRTDLGNGDRQCFKRSLLWWTSTNGVNKEVNLGNEIDACYKLVAGKSLSVLPQEIVQLVSAFSSNLAVFQTVLTKAPQDENLIVKGLIDFLQQTQSALQAVEGQAH